MEDGLALLAASLAQGHDHTDQTLHPGASWRMEEVYRTNLPHDGVALSPASEFSLHENYAFVSLFHPSAGFVILDISDPARPVQVGRYDSGTAYVNDVEVSPDGRWAFLPTSPIETRENDPLEGGGLIALGDYGVQVADLSDIAAPKLATFYVAPDPDRMGYHRLDLEEIDGSLYGSARPWAFRASTSSASTLRPSRASSPSRSTSATTRRIPPSRARARRRDSASTTSRWIPIPSMGFRSWPFRIGVAARILWT